MSVFARMSSIKSPNAHECEKFTLISNIQYIGDCLLVSARQPLPVVAVAPKDPALNMTHHLRLFSSYRLDNSNCMDALDKQRNENHSSFLCLFSHVPRAADEPTLIVWKPHGPNYMWFILLRGTYLMQSCPNERI